MSARLRSPDVASKQAMPPSAATSSVEYRTHELFFIVAMIYAAAEASVESR
jgi:hypothetical protein